MSSGLVADVFDVAKKEFLLKFQKTQKYDFSTLSSIDDVYNATDQIQKDQGAKGALRNLRKIEPFLNGLSKYEKVIETFVQAKPDVLALIWGPIRFALVIAQSHLKTYERIVDAMAQIGAVLPNFQLYTGIFETHKQIHQTLCLFFQDILDFHGTVVSFFNLKGWKEMFEILWPKYAGKFDVIFDNIKKHTMLMHDEVQMAHIAEADTARKLALQEYERAHESLERQAFDSVTSSLNPTLYDKELERLSTDCSPGTGGWLAGHSIYTKWLDASDDSSRLFWVQGIPGAGKSHLSSVIIREIRARGQQIIFAFLTYRHRHDISALKILHSFMYQLVLDKKSLRPVLTSAYDENYRQLNSSVPFAKDVFCKLIRHQPVTYIVVDGLDEIAISERTLLVKTLLQMQTEVTGLRVLFSSRAEDDLTRLLDAKAKSVRVHDHNSADLSHYVHQKADEFVAGMGAEPVIATEVHRLMNIVAAKAEGMFLYARLLSVILVEQSSLDAMKHEVKNLPHGLDEAYQRIIERIECDIGTRARQEAKIILELISCSAVPLSKNEIQLAVLVAQGEDPARGCRSMFLNLIQRCGPIIEEVDGTIQFVHHTVQEYLFSSHSKEYLKCTNAHRDIASMCIRYLGSSCFNTELSDKDLMEKLLSGAYVLEGFACSGWLYHVEQAGKHEEQNLLPDISWLLTQMANPEYSRPQSPADDRLDLFKEVAPDIHGTLLEIKAFLRRRWEDLCFDDGKEWQNTDPLSLFKSQIRIWNLLESSLCDSGHHGVDCICLGLKTLYGPRIFKCSWPGCPSSRTGFETRSQRNIHIKAHQRPFKCDHDNCPFSDLGFGTRSLLSSHLDRYHREGSISNTAVHEAPLDEKEKHLILIDTIRLHNVKLIDHILSSYTPNGAMLNPDDVDAILRSNPPSSLVFFILDHSATIMWPDAAAHLTSYLVESCDEETAITLAKRGGWRALREHYRCAAARGSYEMIKAFYDGDETYRDLYFCSGLIPSRPDPQGEAFALEYFRTFDVRAGRKEYDKSLRTVAETCCSIELARLFIERGADVREKDRRSTTRPLLFVATKKDRLESIQLVRFLIGCGADASVTFRQERLQDTPAGRSIQKWTGMSWDEFVADALGNAG